MSGNELQDENIIELDSQDDVQDVEHSEESSDLATETQQEVKKPHVEFSQEQQEVFNKAIAKKTFELRETERRLDAERQERERYAQELEKLRAPVAEIPPMPDPYEDGYEQKVRARDQAIALYAAHQSQNYQHQQAQLARQQEAEYRRQEQVAESVNVYKSNAAKLGIKQEELTQAAQTVANYGINEDLAMAIINDDQGALITTYLADNIEDLDKVVRMTPIQAAMYIASVVKPKAQARKQKISSAPEPTTALRGNGAERSSLPKGYSIK
jgi:hypothetical protein